MTRGPMKMEWRATSAGMSTLGLLGVIFVTLKLGHIIGWSWWWVTLPFWGGPMLFFLFLAVVLLIALLGAVVS